jgi:GMP synthase (glutamine-hydrolysing)
MRYHEVQCFERCLGTASGQIGVFDLLAGAPSADLLEQADVVLLGGSGDYSVAQGGPWLDPALETMVALYETRKPTFCSCWGFQAIALALGGEVVTDPSRAEVGTQWLALTAAGEADPVFGPLGKRFRAQLGHEDIVTRLPPQATCLASSELVENEAFRIEGAPIYATQFHPELDQAGLLERLSYYPSYLPLVGASTVADLARSSAESPHAADILTRFLELVVAPAR